MENNNMNEGLVNQQDYSSSIQDDSLSQQKTITIDPFISSNMDDEVSNDVPVIERVIEVDDPASNKKKKIIIISLISVIVVIIVGILLFALARPKDKNKSLVQKREANESLTFLQVIEKKFKSGNFDKEIQSLLKEHSISSDQVSLFAIDFDSDDDLELMVYAGDDNGNYLFQFDVDDDVFYDDVLKLSSKESVGYVYSLDDNEMYWCCEYQKNYTILKDRKLVIKEDDFFHSYYIVTQKYNNKFLLENMIVYSIGGDIEIESIPQISKDDFLKSNQLTFDDVKMTVEKYFKEKKEKEEEEKKEQLKQQELEEQKNEIFDLNGVLLHYGTYVEEGTSSYGKFVINRDGSCMIGNMECSWIFSTYNFDGSEVKSILIKYADKELSVSSWRSNCISDNKTWNVIYQG